MHENEIETSPTLVRRLLAAQFPQWANLSIEPVSSAGTDHALYRLGNEMVVRLPRIDWALGQAEKEHRWLPQLAPKLPLAIPNPLAKGSPGAGYPWPWSVYQWLEGENPTLDKIADIHEATTQLAQFIVALRSLDSSSGPLAGQHNSYRGVPLAMRDIPTRAAIEALEGTIDTALATAVWEDALRTPPWHQAPIWIHGDLQAGNLLCHQGKLSAVIDFGCLGVGDPACDLIVAWNLLPSEARGLFRNSVHVDDATWKRGRGWALSIALIQLPYYKKINPSLADNARHVIAEVLTDYEKSA